MAPAKALDAPNSFVSFFEHAGQELIRFVPKHLIEYIVEPDELIPIYGQEPAFIKKMKHDQTLSLLHGAATKVYWEQNTFLLRAKACDASRRRSRELNSAARKFLKTLYIVFSTEDVSFPANGGEEREHNGFWKEFMKGCLTDIILAENLEEITFDLTRCDYLRVERADADADGEDLNVGCSKWHGFTENFGWTVNNLKHLRKLTIVLNTDEPNVALNVASHLEVDVDPKRNCYCPSNIWYIWEAKKGKVLIWK